MLNEVVVFFGLLGYLAGSLPFSVWISRRLGGQDVRSGGSGHATATNTIRQFGWLAGALVLVLDIAKGFLVVWAANRFGGEWSAVAAAAGAVIGHCWPLFAGFRGGMGLAVTGGAVLAVEPLGFVVGAGILVLLVLLTRHAARAAVLTFVAAPLAFWWLHLSISSIGILLAAGIVIVVRFAADWNRQYRELWLDREPGDMNKTSRST